MPRATHAGCGGGWGELSGPHPVPQVDGAPRLLWARTPGSPTCPQLLLSQPQRRARWCHQAQPTCQAADLGGLGGGLEREPVA